jgi:YegS/Rv2252/BmrU family lipid kinase
MSDKRFKLILNPVAGRGYTAEAEPLIRQVLTELGINFELVHTNARGHAIELAEQAKRDGFDTVVAVGGDGTTNEVMNGLINASGDDVAGTMGLLGTGSGSDFTFNVGVPSDIEEACRLLAKGETRVVDVGKLTLEDGEPRYFDNQLGIGFDGVVTVEARKYKRLRGMALYLPVVLKTVFLTNKATTVDLKFDDQQMNLKTVQISIANGSREGGGFYMTPEAKIDDGYLDLCIVQDVGKMGMMKLIPHFMKGTHTAEDAVSTYRAKKVAVSSEENLIAHFDGELLCTEGHRIECEVIPGKLRLLN